MSYPDPKYLAPRGEVSSSVTRYTDEPNTGTKGENSISYVATGVRTDGDYGLYRVDMGPRTMGAAEHFHRTISESFYVLSGEVTFNDGQKWVKGGEGDFLYVPPGGLHGFQNDADEPLSMLLIFAPGAPREEYFEEAARYAEMSIEEREKFYAKHDTYFTDLRE